MNQKFGVRYVDYRLRLSDGRELDGGLRFALMKPFEERGRRETFLFGSAGAAGPQRFLAWELAGAKNSRGNSGWSDIQPQEGVWNFKGHDNHVEGYNELGIGIQYVIGPPPDWAVAKDYVPKNPGASKSAWRRPDPEAFREFVHRLSERYRGKIPYYIVGNEPDLVFFCNYTEDEYVELLKIAYETIKKNDPDAKVMPGGLSSLGSQTFPNRNPKLYNSEVLKRLLTDAKPYYDVFAFHGHGPTPHYRAQLKRLREMGAIGGDKPWISAETGIDTATHGEREQARTLFQKFVLAWAYGATGLDWYNFHDIGNDPKNKEHRYGLYTHDSQPKPALLAYAALTDLLYGGEYRQSPIEDEDVHLHQFRSAENSFVFPFWSMTDRKHLILVSGISGDAALSDIYRNETSKKSGDGGVLLLKAESEPAALIVRQEKPPVVNGLFFDGDACNVVPGQTGSYAFTVRNPLDRRLNATITFSPPTGVKGGERKSLDLAPGQAQTWNVTLNAEPSFRSFATAPETMRITMDIRGVGHETLDWEVISNITIPDKPSEEATFTLDRESQLTSYAISGPENHLFRQGPQDLSAEIRLHHADGALHLNASVTDDIHRQKSGGADMWLGDSVQFVMAIPGQNGHWTFGLARRDDGRSETWCWDAPAGKDAKEAASRIRLETTRDEAAKKTGYAAEIPFDAVGLSHAIGRRGFRFNILVNDNDGEKRESAIRLQEGIEHGAKPSNYPFINFR